MGGTTFMLTQRGESAREAFGQAVEDALYEEGHGGYTGSIAEKDCFTRIPLPEGVDAEEYAYHLIDKSDERINDKWGPAGCLDLGDGKYLFFGWASC